LAEFPDRRLPHTSLQRWHDLRVDQLLSLQEEQVAIAQEFAERLAAPGIEHLGAAVCNALSESVLRLKLEGGDEQRIRDELCRLARVVATAERTEIARRRMELEDRKYAFELAEKVARQLSENAAIQNREKYLVHHLKKSPVFRPYLENLAEMQAAKAAAEAGQKKDKKAPRSPASSAWSGVRNAAETKTNAKWDDYCEPAPDGQPASRDIPPSPASSRQTSRQSGLHAPPPELDDRTASAAIMGVLWTRFAERMAKLLDLDSPAEPSAATHFEKSEPDQGPELDDDPEGGAGALARGLQSTTNSRASQPAAGTAASDDDPERGAGALARGLQSTTNSWAPQPAAAGAPSDDDPEGGAGALARGLQSTTNSRASQPAAGGAPSDDDPEPGHEPESEDDSESDDQSGPEEQPRSENDDAEHAGSDPDTEPQPEYRPEVAPSRDLPRKSALPAGEPPPLVPERTGERSAEALGRTGDVLNREVPFLCSVSVYSVSSVVYGSGCEG
jgi:hypothetical protein